LTHLKTPDCHKKWDAVGCIVAECSEGIYVKSIFFLGNVVESMYNTDCRKKMGPKVNLLEGEGGAAVPLAERLRPVNLSEVVGQGHLLGPEGPIGRMVANHKLASMILWGPPGCGKTTIARLLAEASALEFVSLSAILSGVAELRKIFEAAEARQADGRGTLLFVDEIHRFQPLATGQFSALC
jgi:hypothetical protein